MKREGRSAEEATGVTLGARRICSDEIVEVKVLLRRTLVARLERVETENI